MDNTVTDFRYEIAFENYEKGKNNFLLNEALLFFFNQKYILFLEIYVFRMAENLMVSTFFLRGRY